MFKKVVHSLKPGESPSNSASYQAPNYVQRSEISQNTLKRCVSVAFIFNLLKTSSVADTVEESGTGRQIKQEVLFLRHI